MEQLHNQTDAVVVTECTNGDVYDYIVDIPAGREVTVLQLSDLQLMSMDGVRNETRYQQIFAAFYGDNVHDQYTQVWRYVDEAIERTKPALIVLAGDLIYGQTDDGGALWLEVCEQMDSYGIPWFVVFGNHDNESGKGVLWQIEQVRASKYGVLKRGSVTGNSNYSVGLRQDGKFIYTLYMVDTNGCRVYPENPGEGMMPDNPDIALIMQKKGICDDQIAWLCDTANAISEKHGEIPAAAFMHIALSEAVAAVREQYPSIPERYLRPGLYGERFDADLPGDSGCSYEGYTGLDTEGRFWAFAKEHGVKGLFFAHAHIIASSIVYDGIRLTYGLKSSTHDYHHPEMLGALAITFGEGGALSVDYNYTELPYQTELTKTEK